MTEPMKLALVSAKGGVAKSTLASCLAVEAVREGGQVYILDLDPMGALARWWELRGEADNPALVRETFKIVGASGFDIAIIDSPPSLVAAMKEAVGLADLVLIPIKASPIDLESVDVVVELCEQQNKKFAFVMTMFDPSHKHAKSSIKYLRDVGYDVLDETMSERPSYVAPMQLGKTGPESQDRRAAKLNQEEITALWKAVKARVRKAVRK
jgi:chromosome partitioning protein